MVDRLVITYKCEHAVVGKNGVIRCPFRDNQKKWIENNVFIKEKVAFPVCPKRMQSGNFPLVCAKYELPALNEKSERRCDLWVKEVDLGKMML